MVRVYAVPSISRLGDAPDIPTASEAGLPGFVVSNWRAVWAPKGTPAPIVARLNAAGRETLADPAVRKRRARGGPEVGAAGPPRPAAARRAPHGRYPQREASRTRG